MAIRAVQLAAPFNLPAQYYNGWKRIAQFRFDRKFLASSPLGIAAPAFAQAQLSPPSAAPTPAPNSAGAPHDDGGSTGSVTDDNAWQDSGIAIPTFATDQAVPTSADGGNTAASGKNSARVIYNDLKNNGSFKPVGP
ncbi:hypothetical protein OY671_011449, partial [Metschnikowia pulcherrima]